MNTARKVHKGRVKLRFYSIGATLYTSGGWAIGPFYEKRRGTHPIGKEMTRWLGVK